MGLVSGIAVFFIVWWTVLFAVLPWGVRRTEEPEPGMEPGAPQHPDLFRKFLATTAVAAIIWVIIYFAAESDLISFRDLARRM